MEDEHAHDPITSALLSDSHYDRLRLRRYGLFRQSISTKLALQGVVFATLALVFPLAATLPASTRALFPGGDPLSSTPKILVLGAYAGALETVAALGLVYVGYRLYQGRDDLTEQEARHLLNVEEVASAISLVTGVAAVAAVDGFFLLGHAGEEAMAAFMAAGGNNPFAAGVIPVTVWTVAVPAAVGAVVLFGLSWLFSGRLSA